MDPFTAVTAIVIVFVGLAAVIAWADGLTFLAPMSTDGIRASAEYFCVDECRVDGRCPLGGADEPAVNCPLRKYVSSDAPTQVRGRPSERPFDVEPACGPK